MGMTEKIHETIEFLKTTDIDGCITGSSMLPDEDFDLWASQPDVDLFVYSDNQLIDAVAKLQYGYGWQPMSAGEEWKLERTRNHDNSKDYRTKLSTVKLTKDGVIINVTRKYNKNTMFDVLASFDMSIIMIGYDIRKHVLLDLRCGWPEMVHEDPENRWSNDPRVAVPNPLRNQDVDMYTVRMWVRQYARVEKYWDRGFDTRPMAEFYIDCIEKVIAKGQLFDSEKSEIAYDEFVTLFQPLADRMKAWLEERKDC